MHIKDTIKDWNLKELREDFISKNTNKSPYDYNTAGAIKNQLMNAYLSIYRSREHLVQTQTPLGGLTDQLKKLARLIEEDNHNNDLYAYSATHQNELKFQYNGGQKGIAPFALNNVHHILGQIARLEHTYGSLGLLQSGDSNNGISLHEKYGKDGLSILSWLSAMIDAHVDLAKDNYIMKLNVNEITYNVVSLLLRGGLGIDTFKFLSQPILKEYARAAINSGKNKMALFYSEKAALQFLKGQWENYLSEEGKNKYENEKSILSSDVAKEVIDIANDLTNLNYINKNINSFDNQKEKDEFVIYQLKALDLYIYFDKISKDLNNFVQLSQIDTKKYGKTAVQVIHYNKRLQDFVNRNKSNNPIFKNADKILPIDNIIDGETLLGPYYRNSVLFLLEILPRITIYASPVFMKALSTILDISGNSDTLNKRFIDSIADELYATIVGEFFHDEVLMITEKSNPGANLVSLWKDVVTYVGKVQTGKVPEAEYLKNNYIMKAFSKLPVATEVQLPIDYFLGTAKKAFADKLSNDDYMYDWLDMINADRSTEEGKRISSFAKKLFIYSFYNSGFRNKLHSFFNIIPPSIIKELELVEGQEPISLNEFIKFKKDLYSDPILGTEISATIDEVFLNNWQNRDLIESIFIGNVNNPKVDEISFVFNSAPLGELKEDNSVSVVSNLDSVTAAVLNPMEQYTYNPTNPKETVISQWSRLYVGDNINNDPVFTKYVIYYKKKGRTKFHPHLMKYIGYYKTTTETPEEVTDSDGKTSTRVRYVTQIHPVYKTVPRKSFDKGGITFREYWFKNSAIEENQSIEEVEYTDSKNNVKSYKVHAYIKDGQERLFFNHPKISDTEGSEGFIYGKDMVFIDDYNVSLVTSISGNSMRDLMVAQEPTITKESTTPEFDKLPYRSVNKTMTYAGIGSRETPKEVLNQMREIAMELSSKGYSLNTGDAKGADTAFRSVSPDNKTNIYTVNDATDTTRIIAKEIHPNPNALNEYSLNLMARNTNQIFGKNLDTPVDFVLFWAKETNNSLRPEGGTGQAVEMARRKGIPSINMLDPNWREKLDIVLNNENNIILESNIYTQLGNKTQSTNVKIEPWNNLKNMTEPYTYYEDTKGVKHIVHIIATRIKNSNEHFGNPFTHDEKISSQNKSLIKVSSVREAVEKYINWIISSQDSRAMWIRNEIKSGKLQGLPILYYAELNEPSHATALDYLINKYDWSSNINIKTVSSPQLSEMTLSQLKDAVNEKYKNKPGYIPLTLRDMTNMSQDEINNLKNCL